VEKNLSEVLIAKIHSLIPKNVKPTSYLMDLFDLSRESIYRRIRGEIPFTLEEVYKLSVNLGVSIDELVGKDTDNNLFPGIQADEEFNASKAFYMTLKQYLDETMKFLNSSYSETILTVNRIPLIFVLNTDYLFKFFYYKWMHQTHDVPLNYYFSDTIVPPEIISIAKEAGFYGDKVDNNTFVVDRNLYVNTIREIQYYYKRKLITEDEFLLLKEELLMFLGMTERLAQKGENHLGAKYHIYVSTFDIESNSGNTKFNQNDMVSTFYVYPVNPIVVRNYNICSVHKHWLSSLKKYSTLISKSNEILQAEFYSQQYDYLKNMDKVMY